MVTIERRVEGGASTNEDHVWFGDGVAVVLDGATGLGEVHVSDAESDGRWYVEALAEEVGDRTDANRPLSSVVSDAIAAVAARFAALSEDAELEEHEVPSAAGVVLRWDEDELEYLVLGDCSLLLETRDGIRSAIGEGPRELDQRVVSEMMDIRENGDDLSYRDVREQVQDQLVKHRKLKNQPGGYWTFGVDPGAVDHAQTGTVDRSELNFLVAFTDGFEPLYDPFDAFDEWGDLVSYLKRNGIDRAVRILRALEGTDPECTRYPRLKPSDDVGVLTVDL